MEPDCAFYFDERARGYRAALVEGKAAADSFVERTPFDLVVEVEITNADEGKIARYGDIGVRELWRLHGRKGTHDLRADFFALHPGRPPRRLAASAVLAGLTPGWPMATATLVFVVTSERRPDTYQEGAAGLAGRRGPSTGFLYAFDKETGEEVWRTELPDTPGGGPMTYVVNRRQFIVVPVGGRGQEHSLVAYALPSG